jgi:hypothetical protein
VARGHLLLDKTKIAYDIYEKDDIYNICDKCASFNVIHIISWSLPLPTLG